MPRKGIDLSFAKPTVAQIEGVGADWVARYFSTDPDKNLTAGEVKAYTAAKLGIVTVWETTARRAIAGHAAGIADAKSAESERKAVGLPDDHAHYFAVDADLEWAEVQPYFDGVVSVVGLARTGTYGDFAVMSGAFNHGIRLLWQTGAWSNGKWHPHSTIRQIGGTTLSGGADWDEAEVPYFGQSPKPVTAVKKPVPVPAKTYKVESGDSLSSIAEKLKYPGGWLALYEKNHAIIGKNPNLIHIGLVLHL